MKIPDNLLYTKDHEWIEISGNTAIIGITEYAQGELGDIIFILTLCLISLTTS